MMQNKSSALAAGTVQLEKAEKDSFLKRIFRRTRNMKRIELSVLESDLEPVLKYVGRRALMQFTLTEAAHRDKDRARRDSDSVKQAEAWCKKIAVAADFLQVELSAEPEENSEPVDAAVEAAIHQITGTVAELEQKCYDLNLEKERYTNMLDSYGPLQKLVPKLQALGQLNFVNLKVGQLGKGSAEELQKTVGTRAVIMPLEEGSNEVLAVSSKKGRFALDSGLRESGFSAEELPKLAAADANLESVTALSQQLSEIEAEEAALTSERKRLAQVYGGSLNQLYGAALMSRTVEDLRTRLVATKNAYLLSGWIPADLLLPFANTIMELTGGRAGLISYEPFENPDVQSGREFIPISYKHGRLARVFEPVVASYGTPL